MYEIVPVDRSVRDVIFLKLSSLFSVAYGHYGLLKNVFLMKLMFISIFGIYVIIDYIVEISQMNIDTVTFPNNNGKILHHFVWISI